MKGNVSTSRFTAIAVCVVAVLCTCGGCDDPADLLGQAMGYTASVSQGMALRGWAGFPSNPLALAQYARDLAASVKDARAGVVTEGLGDGGEDFEPSPQWQHTPTRCRDERKEDIRDRWWR
jgi:hypothetical protein